MEPPTKCTHHWVLGDLTKKKSQWVWFRAAQCKHCNASTEIKEREYPMKLAEEYEELSHD